jgi:uncharacterized lipoprotein
MTSAWRIVALSLLLLAAGGCHFTRGFGSRACHEPQTYLKAQSIAPLKIPAGLDAPDTASALRLPHLNEPAPPPRRGKEPCLDAPPPFKVQQGARAPQA